MPDLINDPDFSHLDQILEENVGKASSQEFSPTDPNPEIASPTVGQRIADVIDSANSGIGSAVHETAAFGASVLQKVVGAGEAVSNKLMGPDYLLSEEGLDAYTDWDNYTRAGDGSNYQPKTVAGGITQGGSQFITAFIGAGKFLKAGKAFNGLTTTGQIITTSAVADAVGFNPSQDRLSNLVNDFAEKHPSLQNPLSEFFAADSDDTEAEGRLKNALEGMMLGVVVNKFFLAIRATRQALRAKPKDAQVILEKAADDLEAQSTKLTEEAPKPTEDVSEAGVHDAVEIPSAVSNDSPILSPDGVQDLFSRIKDNPDWLPAGSVTKGRDFNFAKMDSEDGAKLAIDELSNLLAPEISRSKGGIQTHQMIVDMADVIGTNPEQLSIALSAQAKEAPQQAARLVAGKELLQSMARRVSDLARQINSGTATKATQDEFTAMANRTGNLLTSLKALQTGAARTTAAGRIRTRDSFTNEEIRLLIAADGNPKAVAAIVRPLPIGKQALDAFLSYRINALLSNPITHARNLIGGVVNSIALPVERMVGGALTNQPDVMKNGAHVAMALHQGIWDSLKMAGKSLKVEESILQPFVSKLDSPRFAISAKAFDIKNPTLGQVVDVVGQVFRIPTRFLQAEDEFVKQINYRAQTVADATQEGIKKGFEGADLAAFVDSSLRKAFNEFGEGIDPRGMEYASRATFTAPSVTGSWTAGVEQFAHNHPLVRLVIPFIRTPSNIMKGLWFRTPGLNLLSREFQANLREGGTKQADAIGQMATGALMWSGAITLAMQGNITGGGPSNPKARQVLLDTGWRPYSFKIGDEFVSFNGIDPTAMFLGLAADIADVAGAKGQEALSEVIGAASIALAKNLSSKTYLYGLTQALNAISDPDRNAKAYLRNFVASNIPTGIKKIAGLVPTLDDPYLREVRSLVDALRNRIPGLSDSLPPKRNLFGEPVPVMAALGPDLVSPFFSSKLTDSEAKKELARLGAAFDAPNPVVGNVDLTTFRNEKGQDAYDRWQELLSTTKRGGKTLVSALESLVTSSRYQKWKDVEESADAAGETPKTLNEVRATLEEYRMVAYKAMLREYPEVAEAIRNQKKAATRADNGLEVPKELLDLLGLTK